MKDFKAEHLDNLKRARLYDLVADRYTAIINLEQALYAMRVAEIDYYGAIDNTDKDLLFDFYGLLFQPAKNKGENMYYITRL